VGVILYEALTGTRPFDGDSAAAILQRVVHEEPAPLDLASLASISPAIQGVLDKALAKDPARRFATAEAMATALRAARNPAWSPEADAARSESRSRSLMVPGIRPPAPSSPLPWGALTAVAGVVLAALLAAGGWYWVRHHRRAQAAPPPVVAPVVVPAPPPPVTPEAVPEPVAEKIKTLDEAEAALDKAPEEALAFLEPMILADPGNERATALRIVALYTLGRYAPCAKAMGEARAAGHPILTMAKNQPRFRKLLDEERATPRLPRRTQP
jgi:hypothetical protein